MIQFEKKLTKFRQIIFIHKNMAVGRLPVKSFKKLVLLFLKDFSLILSISQSSYNEHDMKMVVPILAIIVIFAFCQNYKVFPFPASSTRLESLKTLTQIFTDLEKKSRELYLSKSDNWTHFQGNTFGILHAISVLDTQNRYDRLLFDMTRLLINQIMD